MVEKLKKLFGAKTRPQFSDEDYQRHYELKKQALERVLGEMYPLVGHALIPFQVGGALDVYFFPNAIDGTALVTMELIEPDGTGPRPSRIGTYELIAFTKHKIGDSQNKAAFDQIQHRLWATLTVLARYSYMAKLNPVETVEVPAREGEPPNCVILDEYRRPGVDFIIGNKRHGLLLVIEVFRSEMEYAMKHGSQLLLDKLRARGHYPYSDLDREPVV